MPGNKHKSDLMLKKYKDSSFTLPNGTYEAEMHGIELHSNFQPIYSLSHRKPIGYEGLLRGIDSDKHSISRLEIFNTLRTTEEVIELDHLSCYLHIKNYVRQTDEPNWLFLNVHPVVLMGGKKNGSYIEALFNDNNIKPENIVIEILEESVDDKDKLNEAIEYYRELGCLIAIDDFGKGNSNFDRVLEIKPDIVKFDKSIIKDIKYNSVANRMLTNLVSLIHECGSLVLLEGIEEEEQALKAVDSGADFVQGYYLSKPNRNLLVDITSDAVGEGGMDLSHLCLAYQSRVTQREESSARKLNAYIVAFDEVSTAIVEGELVEIAINHLLQFSGVERCYMLNRKGHQLGKNYFPEDHADLFPQRFAVLEEQTCASWFRRPYFRRAISEPGKVHISRPYLSMTAGIVCITLSILVKDKEGNNIVLCCDIDWSDR